MQWAGGLGRLVLGLSIALAASSVLATAGAATSSPPTGSLYRGTTSEGKPVTIRVVSRPRSVRIDLDYVATCQPGGTQEVDHAFFHKSPYRPRLHGNRFSKIERDHVPASSRTAAFAQTQRIDGTFAADGSSVTGHYSQTRHLARKSSHRCDSATVTFSATRAG